MYTTTEAKRRKITFSLLSLPRNTHEQREIENGNQKLEEKKQKLIQLVKTKSRDFSLHFEKTGDFGGDVSVKWSVENFTITKKKTKNQVL